MHVHGHGTTLHHCSARASSWPSGPLSAGAPCCWRRAVQAGADGAGELSEEGVEAAEAAVGAARAACEALQRQLLDGELRTYAALGGLLGQAERRHADAAEAGRQHFDTFFGTARPWPLAHSTDVFACTPAAPCQQCELAVVAESKGLRAQHANTVLDQLRHAFPWAGKQAAGTETGHAHDIAAAHVPRCASWRRGSGRQLQMPRWRCRSAGLPMLSTAL